MERCGHGSYYVIRHGRVDFDGHFDEAGLEVKFPGFPGEIERVYRNAMSAQSRPGIKRMKTKRLGGSRLDYFPDIDVHAQAQQLEFVDQGDVHAAVDVLQQFGHLRRGRTGYMHNASENTLVERARDF